MFCGICKTCWLSLLKIVHFLFHLWYSFIVISSKCVFVWVRSMCLYVVCEHLCFCVQQPEYPDVRHLVCMLHIIFWVVGQKQKWIYRICTGSILELPIMTYAPAPCKTMPALAPEHLRSPEAPSYDSTLVGIQQIDSDHQASFHS